MVDYGRERVSEKDRYHVIYGKGIVDLTYTKNVRKNKKTIWKCPFFERWRGLIRRCYSDKTFKRNPQYENCTICDGWLTFSKFKEWMEQHDWCGKELDKDLLIKGNKHYSPENCVWVSHGINIFICDKRESTKSEFHIGTTLDKETGKWRAQCSNPFGKTKYEKRGYIGLFETRELAHLAWKQKKHEYACKFSEFEKDERIIQALRTRYK